MNLGRTIRGLRIGLGLSQMELCSKCNIAQTSLSQIEGGIKRPHEKNLRKICKALKISQVGIYILSIEESDISKDKLELYKTIRPTLTKIFMQ
jgi:transcriptional regulator with XRE-family HTH domain